MAGIKEASCMECKYFLAFPVCKAFPQGIPEGIANGQNSHEEPYSGDNGIQFEPIIPFVESPDASQVQKGKQRLGKIAQARQAKKPRK